MKGQERKGKYRKGQEMAEKARKGQEMAGKGMKGRKGRKDLKRREKGRKRRQEGSAICLSVFYYSIQLQVADALIAFLYSGKGRKGKN